jgi:hypothetical protein
MQISISKAFLIRQKNWAHRRLELAEVIFLKIHKIERQILNPLLVFEGGY